MSLQKKTLTWSGSYLTFEQIGEKNEHSDLFFTPALSKETVDCETQTYLKSI